MRGERDEEGELGGKESEGGRGIFSSLVSEEDNDMSRGLHLSASHVTCNSGGVVFHQRAVFTEHSLFIATVSQQRNSGSSQN